MERENEVARAVVDAALLIHRTWGPGLLESAYRGALVVELQGRGLRVETEVPIEAEWAGRPLGIVYRADLVVDGRVIVEVKAVADMHPVHRSQVLTYLRLTGLRLGLLVNFGQRLLKDGVNRVANGMP